MEAMVTILRLEVAWIPQHLPADFLMSHAPAFQAPDPAHLAELFPGYEIVGLIATGGMGAVYQAVQRSLDRPVAIKVLPREFGADASFREGFEAEAKAMAKLNHPNLIGVYDFGEVEGMLFIIMEFVPGESLYHLAYGKMMDGRDVTRMIGAVCDGLAHAHEHGILHRDIKPANILLDLQSRPKIGDFGLARPVGRREAEGEMVYGTPHYTAPEVLNRPEAVDFRADVFSVGVMLHELLTGKLPAADNRPPSVISGCDARFDAIVKRATQPMAELRYPSAAEMAADLHSLGASLATPQAASRRPGVPQAPVARRATRHTPVRGNSSGGNGGMVLVLAAILGAGAYFFFFRNKDEAPKPAPPPVTEPKGSATDGLPTPGIPKVPTPSPGSGQTQPEEVNPFGTVRPPGTSSVTPSNGGISETPSEPSSSSGSGSSSTGTSGVASSGSGASGNDSPSASSGGAVGSGESAVAVAPSTFDVPGFLTKARGIMREKSGSSIKTYNDALAKNFEIFDRDTKRALRKYDSYSRETRREKGADADARFKEWKDYGGRIPNDFKVSDLNVYDREIEREIDTAGRDALTNQKSIDAKLTQDLGEQAKLYVVGLQKQIERLPAGDGAIAQLEKEIDRTRNNPEHFADLMLLGSPGDAIVGYWKWDKDAVVISRTGTIRNAGQWAGTWKFSRLEGLDRIYTITWEFKGQTYRDVARIESGSDTMNITNSGGRKIVCARIR